MEQDRVFGKRILLADDQQGVREAIRFLLLVDQHTVTEARNGKEALDLFAPGRFDLVVTDYAMPVMSGNELAFKIKQVAPSQPILMITAYSEELGKADNPVDAVLNKPFSFAELRRAIARLVGAGCVAKAS
ncbi:MAG TPA: response regulator [Candidatus Acidoferrum sp.]|nr:response regulator [Candidatus Acidoferrum sp.]